MGTLGPNHGNPRNYWEPYRNYWVIHGVLCDTLYAIFRDSLYEELTEI